MEGGDFRGINSLKATLSLAAKWLSIGRKGASPLTGLLISVEASLVAVIAYL